MGVETKETSHKGDRRWEDVTTVRPNGCGDVSIPHEFWRLVRRKPTPWENLTSQFKQLAGRLRNGFDQARV